MAHAVADSKDIVAVAREHVSVGPTPDWVAESSIPKDFKTKSPAPATYLLIDRQVHAESHQTHVRIVVRLETAQAVQHQSQWRVEFIPKSQWLTLHSIKIRRGDSESECLSLARIHFLRRETGLEGFVIDGWVTLLSLLDDVRPGDILDWSYTIENRPLLLPEVCSMWLPISEGVQIGKLHLSVRFAETRPLKWKSSSTDFAPVETRENGQTLWVWSHDNFTSPEPEEQTPTSHISHPWVQVSDCPDWQTVATAFYNAWQKENETTQLIALAEKIKATETDPTRQIAEAIRIIQDDFRYLSVNLELGGQVPTDADTVILRRYGDCKDLAFLMAELLRRLGFRARPILVNTILRSALREVLPSAGMFNHAVVEFELNNETRWVDATMKWQGGGALDRIIPNFETGLPVDKTASGLIPQPNPEVLGTFEIKEHILVDTTGEPSHLAVIVRASGGYAEHFRAQFQDEGVEAMEKKRLEACQRKFPQIKRVGSLQHRDDRHLNQVVLSEVFEINGFLMQDGLPDHCFFNISNDALGALPVPAKLPRRTPYALPHPCNLVHIVEIESLGLGVSALPAFRARNEFFDAKCVSRAVRKFTTMTFSMSTLADAVPADQVEKYKAEAERVLAYGGAVIRLPIGFARLRKRHDFGALPAPVSPHHKTAALPTAPKPVMMGVPSPRLAVTNTLPESATVDRLAAAAQKTTWRHSDEVDSERRGRRKRRRSSHTDAAPPPPLPQEGIAPWKWVVAAVLGLGLLALLLYLFNSRIPK